MPALPAVVNAAVAAKYDRGDPGDDPSGDSCGKPAGAPNGDSCGDQGGEISASILTDLTIHFSFGHH